MTLLALVLVGGFISGTRHTSSSTEVLPQKVVTLVIDFGKKSQIPMKVITLNDVPATSTGWDMFGLAAVTIQGTDQFPTGFACRIAGWPSKVAENCKKTPAYSAGHWAYFVTNSQLSASWVISGVGASMHIPDCGGYEGWSWVAPGANAEPPRLKISRRGCK